MNELKKPEDLQKTFKKQIKKYHSWCFIFGYNSTDLNTLLWFFNHYKKAIKINVEYYIVYKSKKYNANQLIEVFKNNKKY